MKKVFALLLTAIFLFSLVACSNSPIEIASSGSTESTSTDTQDITSNQTSNATEGSSSEQITEGDNNMSNINEKETRVTLTIEDTMIPATLNNTLTAQEFIKLLPFSITASKSQFDFCGTAESLVYDESETQAGWKNGDIGYSRGWFALFFDGEEQSQSYTSEMIIGHIDDEYLDTVSNFNGSIHITVELAQ